ncbi:MAG: hypothetical protein HZC25_15195 [Rhodospirillales bacterium]|nr:hypothetical protein [Rhodospirillales bacterium]
MRLSRILFLVLVLFGLGGCYLPNQFDAEIRILRDGTFTISFQGLLIYAPLVYEISSKNLSPDEQRQKMQVLERDLRRDSGFAEVQPQGKGQFKVRYKHSEKLEGSVLYTFVRRNSDILSMKLDKQGIVTIRGSALSADDAQRALQLGIRPGGTLKVVTDLPQPLNSNAQETQKQGALTVYVWKIQKWDQAAPKIAFKLR